VPLDETFNTHNGVFRVAGRVIKDVHEAPEMTFADVIRHSSNIGMVLAAERLTPQEHYEALRDFGFGVPTGVQFPSEAAGMFRSPARWSKQSKASLSMGYEITVTPLQLAAAYGALANDGVLLQPTLVKEIRDADGQVVFRHTPRAVRRVVSPGTAAAMRRLLRDVVDSGTAKRADLATFEVGGKSGTARRTAQGRYVQGAYTANFVGLFPADEPQLVVLVKIDAPTGTYYGGQVAAPVMKAVLEAALASSDVSLDHERMTRKPLPPDPPRLAARRDSVRRQVVEAAGELATDGSLPVVLTLPAVREETSRVVVSRPVPAVAGLPLRRAVHALHQAGFRVRVVEGGAVGTTEPAAGTVRPAGTMVAVHAGR
jgi:cell division protein FtsI (penicillin-binding protein 3)